MDAASLLRSARKRANLTQVELATRAGTSQPAVARCERGGVVPTIPSLRRLLRACGEELVLASRPHRPSELEQRLLANRDAILAVAAKRSASNIRIFGSVARGEDMERSDIDLLVDLPRGRTLMTLAALSAELSEIVGAEVDVSTETVLRPDVRRRALAEAVKL
jgi:uncharacterized protein